MTPLYTTPVPNQLRSALIDAMGGWGPYTVGEVHHLFEDYDFHETAEGVKEQGVRRTAAGEYLDCIDWDNAAQRRRLLSLVEEVLTHYPVLEGEPDRSPGARLRRALSSALENLAGPSEDDLAEVIDVLDAERVTLTWQKALERRQRDPEGAITAARATRLHRADLERNRQAWNAWAPDHFQVALDYWLAEEPIWGIWATPETRLGLLAGVEGMDAIELGCGTAYVCAWLAQRGARPVGVDISDEQLDSARMFQRQFHQPFPLIRASADDVPFDDQSFDLALSEYGASTWVDPYWWVPEAARLLRPGGKLVFFVSGAIMMTCTPSDGTEATRALVQDYFGIHRFEFQHESFVEFHLSHGDWIRVLRANGFELEDLIEVQPSEGASSRFRFVAAEWARRWPSEEIWIARRRG